MKLHVIYVIFFLNLIVVSTYAQWQGTNPVWFTAGNVGIGTTSPSVKLEVLGQDVKFFSNTLTNTFSIGRNVYEKFSLQVTDGHGYLDYEQDADNNSSHIFYIRNLADGTSSANDIRFQTGSEDRLTVKPDGRIGIGTSTPLQKFQIMDGDILLSRSGIGSSLQFRTDGNGNAFVNNMNNFVGNGSTGNGALILTGQSMLRFQVGNAGTNGTEMMRISDSGNVITGNGLLAGSPVLAVNSTYATISPDPDQNRPLTIRRGSSDNEALSMFLQDANAHFVYKNDEKAGYVDFRIINTDTESGGGAGANDNVVMTLYGTQTGSRVGIGTTAPDASLTVKGDIHAEEVRVDLTVPGPDYVFEKDYPLTSLEDLKTYIDQHKHLPEVPSAKEMEENGINLKEMNLLLLRKIEELTLHLIEQNKQLAQVKEESRVSADASAKKVEELTLCLIDQNNQIAQLKEERRISADSLAKKERGVDIIHYYVKGLEDRFNKISNDK
jgi:hypothetical protein